MRDFAQVDGAKAIDEAAARRALGLLEVDEFGLDDLDRRLLAILIEQYEGGPAGVDALAATVGEDRGTLEDLYEPYLIQEGFLQRTPRGRVATPKRLLAPRPRTAPRRQPPAVLTGGAPRPRNVVLSHYRPRGVGSQERPWPIGYHSLIPSEAEGSGRWTALARPLRLARSSAHPGPSAALGTREWDARFRCSSESLSG